MDWRTIRRESDAELDPAWRERFGESSWQNALVVFGELSPDALAALSPAEREHYALGQVPRGSPRTPGHD